MRRSISYCEPTTVLAGEEGTWKFIYTPSTTLPKGARLKFDLGSQGRAIDWEAPSISPKATKNVIYGILPNGKQLTPTSKEDPNRFVPSFEFVLPSALEAGKSFTIILGAPPTKKKSTEQDGNRTQCFSQRRRLFSLFIDPSGKGKYGEPEQFSMDVRGNKLRSIRILVPSFVVRNKRFDVILRFEDEHGNLTNYAAEDTLIELTHEHLRDSLKWKLFVPETGFINLPNLYFNEVGIYTIQLLNTKTKEIFRSAPIRCFADGDKHLFWGLLHGESEKIDSTENIESCLRHFRDERAMNFFASSPFENLEETSNEIWKTISQNIADFDEMDRFVTFLGCQWKGTSPQEGIRQIVFAKDNKSILRKKDQKYATLKKMYKNLSPKEIVSIPSFSMGKKYGFDFNDFDPQFERVVEIYNSWGSSECTKKEGNPWPIQSDKTSGIQEFPEGSVINALLRNRRFGFVAGGLDDRGTYAGFFEGDQQQYHPGLTAIIANEHSRPSIFEALHNRSCYATTGEKIIVGLYLAGSPMGSELSTAIKSGLMVNRHLSGYVAGTTKLKSVEIIRNGKVLTSLKCSTYYLDFTYDDMTPFEKVAIPDKENKKNPPFAFYYLRVTQADGHMAWSSPIWVDLLPISKEALLRRPIKGAHKPKEPAIFIPENEDEEDDEEEEN